MEKFKFFDVAETRNPTNKKKIKPNKSQIEENYTKTINSN
jgi:hypothetical protein